MVAAPIFGYLGDRFNRKVILSCGIFFWSIVTLLSSFIGKEVQRSDTRQQLHSPSDIFLLVCHSLFERVSDELIILL